MTFKVDLHIHTKFSGDNVSDPDVVVRMAIEKGLHAIAFTEHYSYEASEHAEALREQYGDRILIFRGVEFSSAEGHCLIFGVNTDTLQIKNASLAEVVRVVNEKGGAAIPTHPFRGGNSTADHAFHTPGVTAIEGFNGYSLHAQNVKAVEQARRCNLPCTGGSDAHEPEDVGSCFTEFKSAVTYDNFLDQLKAGNYHGKDIRKISRAWMY